VRWILSNAVSDLIATHGIRTLAGRNPFSEPPFDGRQKIRRALGQKSALWALLVGLICCASAVRAETESIVLASNAASRVEFGASKLVAALKAVGIDSTVSHRIGVRAKGQTQIVISGRREREVLQLLEAAQEHPAGGAPAKEGFQLATCRANVIVVLGGDDSGALYGCVELAQRIRAEGKLPLVANFSDKPAMTLRGTCVGMQKTTILPGRKVYEYPYTPELFPWFYDKMLWREYLDFLAANRMNTLYLWNGHPFASLVKLKDYPEAIEVPPDVFAKNIEMFRWLTTECDRRGIWLVQMFYNIFLPEALAEKHGVSTQLAAPTPLASDYTRKSIAEFVKQYPNVGLMVCLGEALQGGGFPARHVQRRGIPSAHHTTWAWWNSTGKPAMRATWSWPRSSLRSAARSPTVAMTIRTAFRSSSRPTASGTRSGQTTFSPEPRTSSSIPATSRCGNHSNRSGRT
jgi:hypothetical protein